MTYSAHDAAQRVRQEREAELRWRLNLRQTNNDRIEELQRILGGERC